MLYLIVKTHTIYLPIIARTEQRIQQLATLKIVQQANKGCMVCLLISVRHWIYNILVLRLAMRKNRGHIFYDSSRVTADLHGWLPPLQD